MGELEQEPVTPEERVALKSVRAVKACESCQKLSKAMAVHWAWECDACLRFVLAHCVEKNEEQIRAAVNAALSEVAAYVATVPFPDDVVTAWDRRLLTTYRDGILKWLGAKHV